MVEPRKAIESVVRYISQHPDELSRIIRSGLGMRLGVPLAALKWILAELTDEAGLAAELFVDPPGLQFGATVDRMNTQIRVEASLFAQNIDISAEHIRIELRVENLELDVLSEEKTQLSALVKSGALNLSRPGDLINELPGMPAVIVQAHGNRIVLDLMRAERFNNPYYRELVGLLSSLVTIKDVRTEDSDHIDVSLRTLPRGPRAASRAVRSTLLKPGFHRARRAAFRLLSRSPARRLLSSGHQGY
ncbi:MAG: hypothetical protein KTR25_19905 [Myxococcales bacterium]|nr:hypothetical protein [Myxococcales bacterium]